MKKMGFRSTAILIISALFCIISYNAKAKALDMPVNISQANISTITGSSISASALVK